MAKGKANKNATATVANAPVKPVNGNATENVKATATVPAAPTNEISTSGKNANTTKKPLVNNTKNTTTGKPFALDTITVASVQQAREIRKADLQRFQKFHNFFIANDADASQQFNSKMTTKREEFDQWVRGAMNPQTLSCIQEIQETQPALMEMIIVSAAITKYGEKELNRRDALGEMDSVVGARFNTSGLRSKQQMPHSVGLRFVLGLVLGLAPEKRATCQLLLEILSHEANGHLVLTPTSENLKSVFGAAAADAGDWDQLDQQKIKNMIEQTQSKKFQETMQQVGGEYLYDVIRTQLKQVGGASFWDAAMDLSKLQSKNLRPRSEVKKSQKDQTGKKNNGQAQKTKMVEKKNLPAEVKVAGAVVPPPAPVVLKAGGQKEGTQKKKQEKNDVPKKQQEMNTGLKKQKEKNVAPVKDQEKNAAPMNKDTSKKQKEKNTPKKQQEKNDTPVKQQEKNTPSKKQKEKMTTPVANDGSKKQQEKTTTPVKNVAPVKNTSSGTIVSNDPAGRAKISKGK